MEEDLDELAAKDPLTRARRCGELLSGYQDWVNEISRMRREAIEELIAEGKTRKEVAPLLGLTVTRVGQILTTGPQVERALLGTGTLTVAVGGKPEAGKPKGEGSAMLSKEMGQAFHLIADTARAYGLDAEQDVVPPNNGHHLKLNRPNLIVLGSPRILRLMEQVIAADGHLGFGYDTDADGTEHWYLTEGERILWSPCDSSKEPGDYAYLGRLPRTDGKGTFLYLAGIHAQGTLAAVQHLTGNMKELYEQVKGKRWSMLIGCRYHPDTKEIESTDPITQIYYSE